MHIRIGLVVAALGIVTWVVLTMNGLDVVVCPLTWLFDIPCPSSGTTRTLHALLRGNIALAMTLNPINLLLCMLFAAIIFVILIRSKSTDMLRNDLRIMEQILRKPLVFIPFILLVIFNWIGVIQKGL